MPLRAGTMPFGKNKKLTMPRAQKTKVPAREDAWEIENETGITGAEEPAAPPAAAEVGAVQADPGLKAPPVSTFDC